jgi:phage replication initiation protein
MKTAAQKYRDKEITTADNAPSAGGRQPRLRGKTAAEGAKSASYYTVSQHTTTVDSSPINNMGENLTSDAYREIDVICGRKIKKTLIRLRSENELCIIDWLNVTIHEDTWQKTAGHGLISTDDIIFETSKQLEKIFGFGITSKRDNGMNYYKESWVLGDDMGYVCLGGQRNTMLITLTGQGCTHAVSGWEKRLYAFLANIAVRPSISRVDLAHDDFDGKYLSVDWADAQWDVRGFNTTGGGRKPYIEHLGNWRQPTGQGRTLNIGRRTAGKFFRCYEKGRQLGDQKSEWCRAELELKSSDRIVPLDILLCPSDYFAGAYPCFAQFAHIETPKRIELKSKVAQIITDAAIRVTKHQYGKYINIFRQLFGDKETLDLIVCNDKNAWPKRLKPLGATAHTGGEPIHKTSKFRTSEQTFFNPPVPFGFSGEMRFN